MADVTNGNGGGLRQIAENPGVIAFAQFMQIVGIPVAAWLFLQVWTGIDDLKRVVVDVRLTVKEIQGEQAVRRQVDEDQGRRIRDLERPRWRETNP